MGFSFSLLSRFAERADEVSRLAEVPAPIKRLYAERTGPPLVAFRSATKTLAAAEASSSKERREAIVALARIDTPYKLARSIAQVVVPDLVLPETLSVLPTDTDRKLAIIELLDKVDDFAGEAWADELLAGDFGRLAPEVVREIEESVHASSALKAASVARAMAATPAYEAFMSFKSAVLAGMGRKSMAYKRLTYRARDAVDETPGGAGSGSGSGEGTRGVPVSETES